MGFRKEIKISNPQKSNCRGRKNVMLLTALKKWRISKTRTFTEKVIRKKRITNLVIENSLYRNRQKRNAVRKYIADEKSNIYTS